MLDINVAVQSYEISPKNIIVGTKGSSNVSNLVFHFSDEWTGLSKKITFYPERLPSIVLVMTTDTVVVPATVLNQAGATPYVITGYDSADVVRISLEDNVYVRDTRNPNANTTQPAQTEIAQLYNVAFQAYTAMLELLSRADGGEFNGRDIELRVTSAYIQWRYVDGAWIDLIPLTSLKGEDGKSIELRVDANYIQWRYVGEVVWSNLISISSLKGDKGDTGAQGIQGLQGVQGIQGIAGRGIEFIWNGTSLGIRYEGDTQYLYSNLQGEQGIRGIAGQSLSFQWSGTQLGVRVGDSGAYTYVDLKGSQGVQGEQGVIFTPTVDANGNISWSNNGGLVNPAGVNIKGVKGDKGDRGEGFVILGYYLNVNDLTAAVTNPNSGDAYGIGSSAPYDIYIWDGVGNQWVNNGALQGAQGEQGKGLEFNWDGTKLGVRAEGDSLYQYVDLIGVKGDIGEQGKGLEFNWDGTKFGVRVEGDSQYQYTELGTNPAYYANAITKTTEVARTHNIADMSPTYTRLRALNLYGNVALPGKNLFDYIAAFEIAKAIEPSGISMVTKDGRYCIYFATLVHSPNNPFPITFKSNTQYTINYDYYQDTILTSGGGQGFQITYTDNSIAYMLPVEGVYNTWATRTFTTASSKTVREIHYMYANDIRTYLDVNTMQIEEGTIATAFEPYIPAGNIIDPAITVTSPDTAQSQTITLTGITLSEGDYINVDNNIVTLTQRGITTDITAAANGQALLSLHGYSPNTTITCDANCRVTYNVDTAIVIDGILINKAYITRENHAPTITDNAFGVLGELWYYNEILYVHTNITSGANVWKEIGGDEITVDTALNIASSNPIANSTVAVKFIDVDNELSSVVTSINDKADISDVEALENSLNDVEQTLPSKVYQTRGSAIPTVNDDGFGMIGELWYYNGTMYVHTDITQGANVWVAVGAVSSSEGTVIYQGTCTTTGTSAAKVASITNGDYKKVDGALLLIRFNATNTSENATLRISSLSGDTASPIYVNNAPMKPYQITSIGHYMFKYYTANSRYQLLNPDYTYDIGLKVDTETYNTDITSLRLQRVFRGTCSSVASTYRKNVTLEDGYDDYVLQNQGALILVTFPNGNTASNLQLEVKGAIGGQASSPILVEGKAALPGHIKANTPYLFQFDYEYGVHDYWHLLNPSIANVGFGYFGTTVSASATAEKVITINGGNGFDAGDIRNGAMLWVRFTNGNSNASYFNIESTGRYSVQGASTIPAGGLQMFMFDADNNCWQGI